MRHANTALRGRDRPRRSARRGLFHLMYATTILLSTLGGKPARASVEHKASDRASHSATASTLRISPEGWGRTSMDDLRLVLEAVMDELAPRFPHREFVSIRVVHGDGGPLAFYDKSADGEYVVRLSAQHSRWHQFVYQFSHELCHIYSNFDNKPATDGRIEHHSNQWFEESVCETAALYTLRKLAQRWEGDPPGPQFAGQGATLRALADYLINEPHRHLPPSRPLASWFKANQPHLEESPYLRDKNEVVANLMLPLFEQAPEAMSAIGYMNLRTEDADRQFGDYLRAWRDACPEDKRGVVQRIIALFEGKDAGGVPTSSPTQLARAAN